MILSGDIGGTKTNIALFQSNGSEVGPIIRQSTFPSAQYRSLESIIQEFIGQTNPEINTACFGIAAPVVEGRAETPNLNWTVSEESLADLLKIDRVSLINDLEATAYGIATLGDSQLLTLNSGEPKSNSNRALIAAGTGLGMAGIFFRKGHYYPMASEGGHTDFAPRTPLEVQTLRVPRQKAGETC